MGEMTVDANAGTFALGELVSNAGCGSAIWIGPGIMGEPRDVDEARRVLLRAVELGVTFIDTAHAYGPLVSERLIGETLAPYRDDMVIATKGGLHRNSSGAWLADCSPATLRAELEQSLQLLRLETIDLYQLHTVDPRVPVSESVGALAQMQREGLIKMIGVSNVDVDDLRAAQGEAQIVSVQNRFSVGDDEPVLDVCEREGLAFIPWYPLRAGAVESERRLRGGGAPGRNDVSGRARLVAAALAEHAADSRNVDGGSPRRERRGRRARALRRRLQSARRRGDHPDERRRQPCR